MAGSVNEILRGLFSGGSVGQLSAGDLGSEGQEAKIAVDGFGTAEWHASDPGGSNPLFTSK